MELNLNLDEVLDLICPLEEKLTGKKQKPDSALRTSFFGQEEHSFPGVPLTLNLCSSEVQLHITGQADFVHPGSEHHPFTVEEQILLDRMVSFSLWRKRVLQRAQFLALALANTKGLDRVKILLCVFAEGRMEMEEHLLEKGALSAALAAPIQTILSLCPLWEKPDVKITFPYPSLRDGQKKLIHAVWDAIKTETKLFACAPTGIGKTMAVLYPALRALETRKAEKVFYASPKNTLKLQAASAVESLQEIRGLRTLVMGARMSLCPEKQEECQKGLCRYSEQLETKLPEALSYLCSFSCIAEKELLDAARRFSVCPFELARKMQQYCQVIICDYNHVFDPNRAIFKPKKNAILLVDEAHNLPARMRESFTETLCPQDLDFFFRDPTPPSQMLREHFAPLTALFTRIEKERNESKEYFSFTLREEIKTAAAALLPKVGFALQAGFGTPSEQTEQNLKALYRKLKKFVSLCRIFKDDFATIYPPEGGVRIYLVDPKEKIRSAVQNWKTCVFFSATLLPRDYYFEMLAGEDGDVFLNLPSPFPREHLFVGICRVDVSHSQRYVTSPQICSIIHSAVSSKPGNYMVFLPSFEYLNLVSQEYKRRFFEHRILVQEKVMTAKKRAEFLKTFEQNRKGTLIGFCVMGGIFSEGVDLKGDSLCGEIIVGTGFPPPSPEAQAECTAYCNRELDGKSFAYTLPGWSRVLQAAGRVIRDENDRGFIILCDTRYMGEDVKELFPESWEDAVHLERDAQLKRELETFWR